VFLPVAMVPGDMVALAGSAQMARLAVMFWAMKGAPIIFRALNDARKKYAPKRNDFVVKTSLSCRGKRIS
jgi:hypothetical protein